MANLDRNLAELQPHLEPGEMVQVSVLGAYECKIMGADSARNGILAATDRRLIFFAKKLTGYDMEVFPYPKISSFETGKGMMGHNINLYTSGNKVSVKWIHDKAGFQQLIEFLKPRVGKGESQPQQAAGDDPMKRLQMRLVNGEITPAQYEEMKRLLS